MSKQEEKTKPNSVRFIGAYNAIDYALKTTYKQKRTNSFADAVRRASKENSLVAKYEEVLLDYARLRNSIVHTGNVNYCLAEPNDEVTENIENIAKILTTPPRALTIATTENLVTVDHTETIAETLKIIHGSGFKNIPIIKDETIIGVANLMHIALELCKQVFDKKDINDYIYNTPISNIINSDPSSTYFEIKSDKLTVDQALTMFYNNRKLACIIITRHGTYLERPLGLITAGDIIELTKIIDEY